MKYRLIDLFSGCGGFTSGFLSTGSFQTVFVNDFDEHAVASYKANFDPTGAHTFCCDILEYLDTGGSDEIPQTDVVVGGPPCQGFSTLNRNREGDERRELWRPFMKVVELSNARVVVMENVPQLFGSPEFEEICGCLKNLGFRFQQASVLNCANYGVPQVRKRTILVACRDTPISLPEPRFCNKNLYSKLKKLYPDTKGWQTVRSVIDDLPPPKGTEIGDAPPLDLHFGRKPTPVSVERYKAVPPGGNRFDLQKNRPDITPNCWLKKKSGSTDLFGRLWWDRPSVTIRTEFFKPEKGRYLHPEQNRSITHREAARIQTFPDTFRFIGNKSAVARQIGNAVPPLLGKAVALEVQRSLEGKTTKQSVDKTIEKIFLFSKYRI